MTLINYQIANWIVHYLDFFICWQYSATVSPLVACSLIVDFQNAITVFVVVAISASMMTENSDYAKNW